MAAKKRLTTRSLLACVVLGAGSAVFVWLAIVLNALMSASLPWAAYPAPTPMFFGAIAAVLLIRKPGVAALTALITALIGFGTMALLAGLCVELAAFLGKKLLRPDGGMFTSAALTWAAFGGGMGGLGLSLGIFMVSTARDALPLHLLLLGMALKILLGIAYGVATFYIARISFRSGVNPQGLPVNA
ncbi:hypothetical protein ACUH91_05030 [Dermabacteraceae bacterium P9123]